MTAVTDDERTYITVRELLRLEGEQALAQARQRQGMGGSAGQSPGGPRETVAVSSVELPRLVGIYGVGKRLFAEVRSGDQAWLFLKGQSLPVGRTAGGEDAYRLKELSGSCVRLERQGEETVLCLPRGGRQ